VDTLIWLLLPFAALGGWKWGFAAAAAYATASFAWTEWRKFRDDTPPE